MNKPEEIVVRETKVACDGGNGPLGHPMIYLNFGDAREICCPYCSRLFKLADDVKVTHGH